MNKLFIDTNIVLDLLGQRAPFYQDAAKLFSLADRKEVKSIITRNLRDFKTSAIPAMTAGQYLQK
ncbi:MAG: PIN domain-containing protein [bacterium]|nr:PIN domain-containing protein [bacterium]